MIILKIKVNEDGTSRLVQMPEKFCRRNRDSNKDLV